MWISLLCRDPRNWILTGNRTQRSHDSSGNGCGLQVRFTWALMIYFHFDQRLCPVFWSFSEQWSVRTSMEDTDGPAEILDSIRAGWLGPDWSFVCCSVSGALREISLLEAGTPLRKSSAPLDTCHPPPHPPQCDLRGSTCTGHVLSPAPLPQLWCTTTANQRMYGSIWAEGGGSTTQTCRTGGGGVSSGPSEHKSLYSGISSRSLSRQTAGTGTGNGFSRENYVQEVAIHQKQHSFQNKSL